MITKILHVPVAQNTVSVDQIVQTAELSAGKDTRHARVLVPQYDYPDNIAR